MRPILTLIILFFFEGSAFGQAERYELGQRLKAFEKLWDKTTDDKLRKKAAAGLPKLTGLFFTGQFGEAGRTLDEARWVLEGKEPSDAEKWAQSLYVVPQSRYLKPLGTHFEVIIQPLYPIKAECPRDLQVQLALPGMTDSVIVPINALPCKAALKYHRPNPKNSDGNDALLVINIVLGRKEIAKREVGVSFEDVSKSGFTFDILAVAEKALKADSIEWATAQDRVELLRELSQGTVYETDVPAWGLYQELLVMIVQGQAGKTFFSHERPGQFLLSIPTGKTRNPARLFVPKGLNADTPGPIVVALHGAGGSENLFFEGYGDGQIVKLCEKRGWMLLAPRSGLNFFGGGPPIGELVDELAKRYPIDPKRVFVVGHSMGAMQAIDAAQKYPDKFAAIAALGGDGRMRKAQAFAELPTFLGIGDKDFLLKNVRGLKLKLAENGAKAVTYREYDGIEHLLICREALPDAFAMFDKVRGKK